MSDPNKDYADLKRRIAAAGLFEKQLGYYAYKIVSGLLLFALGLIFLVMIDNMWLQVANAIFLAFVFVQVGFLGHDAGHRQIFKKVRRNDYLGLLVNLLLGISRSWWFDQHNEHHDNPNVLDEDPHTNIPVIAFDEEQARNKKGFLRTLVKYQAFYFIPFLCLEGIGTRLASISFLRAGKNVQYPLVEPVLMLVHFAVYLGLVFFFMPVWQGVLFIGIHQAVFGLYLGSSFAPNHKGMAIPDEETKQDFLRLQVLTSRNLKSNFLVDFFLAGLGYQIEHHLFTSIPRNKLKDAQKIVRAFCEERSIPYYESGYCQSWVEIISSLHKASAPLRNETSQKVVS